MRPITSRVGMAVAVLVGTAALAASPAPAHETTPTTGAAVQPTGMPGMDASPPGAATTMEPASTAGDGDGAGTWARLAIATVVAAVGTVALVAVRRRATGSAVARLDQVGAAALLFAGVAHCALTASHWAEGWHLGAFFAASGVLLLGQGAVVGLRPSAAAHASVLASTVVLIVLYFLAREVALPLVDHRDPYLVEDVPVKVSEAVAALVAGVALARARVPRPGPALARVASA